MEIPINTDIIHDFTVKMFHIFSKLQLGPWGQQLETEFFYLLNKRNQTYTKMNHIVWATKTGSLEVMY